MIDYPLFLFNEYTEYIKTKKRWNGIEFVEIKHSETWFETCIDYSKNSEFIVLEDLLILNSYVFMDHKNSLIFPLLLSEILYAKSTPRSHLIDSLIKILKNDLVSLNNDNDQYVRYYQVKYCVDDYISKSFKGSNYKSNQILPDHYKTNKRSKHISLICLCTINLLGIKNLFIQFKFNDFPDFQNSLYLFYSIYLSPIVICLLFSNPDVILSLSNTFFPILNQLGVTINLLISFNFTILLLGLIYSVYVYFKGCSQYITIMDELDVTMENATLILYHPIFLLIRITSNMMMRYCNSEND